MLSEEGYHALRNAAGVVERSDRGVLRVTGSDRLPWLQGLLTNDVADLPPGTVRDAAYLTPQGRMLTDVRVLHFSEYTLLDVPAGLAAELAQRLGGLLFSEDADIQNASASLRLIEIHGPVAERCVAGEAVLRDDAFGVPGYVACLAPDDVADFVGRVRGRGATAVDLATLDVVRIEAGRPAFGRDMDAHTIPLEAGIEDRTISFTKGCYVGQEVIVRVMHRGGGRVARRLVGLRLDTPHGTLAPEVPAGAVIRSPEKAIGQVTSATWSPALSAQIALGYVQRDFAAAETTVSVETLEGAIPAQVTALPFVPASSSI